MIIDQFDEMLEQSRKYPLVLAVALHPFIIGQPFRLHAFRNAVRHIMRHRDALWITTPGEIARYCEGLDLKRGAVAQVAARREQFI